MEGREHYLIIGLNSFTFTRKMGRYKGVIKSKSRADMGKHGWKALTRKKNKNQRG